jgi:hypothetical protein
MLVSGIDVKKVSYKCGVILIVSENSPANSINQNDEGRIVEQ